MAFLSQLFSVFSNLQYFQVVVSRIEFFTIELYIQLFLYIILLGCQLFELLKFAKILHHDINQTHPDVDSSTI